VKRINIAIVEDEVEMVNVLKKFFSIRGIPVCYVAYDGNEAVELFRTSLPRPDVILLDNRLPAKNGVSVAKEIMAIDPTVKIIFLSADAQVEKEALESGATLFIKKPSSLQTILNAIDSVSGTAARPMPCS
jgi:DNA-binding response OmpR family regulator